MPKTNLSRPKDKSFEAFKAWIKELTVFFGATEEATEEKLREGWKKFWQRNEDGVEDNA